MKQRFSGERAEAGETLIEVIISSTLMALVVIAMVGGIASVLLGSTVHRKQANGNASLVEAMELVRSPETARVCAVNNASHPYLSGLPSGVTITDIEYQTITPDPSGNPTVTWAPASSYASTCSLTSPLTLQRVTLQYLSADSTVKPSLSFVKGAY